VKLPADAAPDSFNLLPVLLGQTTAKPVREATVHHAGSGKFAIRKGDWVFIDSPSGNDNGVRGEPDWFKQERGYEAHTQPGELFNLREDLIERRNIFAERPAVVRELKSLLEQYQQRGRSTPGPALTNDVPIGSGALPARGAGKLRPKAPK
jgi:hypothetical protein